MKGKGVQNIFFALEKARYEQKAMLAIYCKDGINIRDKKKILQEQMRFYKKLYSSNKDT